MNFLIIGLGSAGQSNLSQAKFIVKATTKIES